MPFGLKDTLWMVKWAMLVVLSKSKRQFTLVHLKDLVVYLQTPFNHVNHVFEAVMLIQGTWWNWNWRNASSLLFPCFSSVISSTPGALNNHFGRLMLYVKLPTPAMWQKSYVFEGVQYNCSLQCNSSQIAIELNSSAKISNFHWRTNQQGNSRSAPAQIVAGKLPSIALFQLQVDYTEGTNAYKKQIAPVVLQNQHYRTDKQAGYWSICSVMPRAPSKCHKTCLTFSWPVLL